MTITGITEFSRSRCKIEIDDKFAFVLYKGELHQYGLQEGAGIGEEVYHLIIKEVLTKRARLRCMNLLQRREYTTSQLRMKLEEGLYPQEVIEDALSYVASFHYTDDLRYAVDYITSHESERSRRRIEQDLFRKGIGKETIEQAFGKWEALGGTQNEEKMIRELLDKKQYRPQTADYKEKQRMYAFLLRKGYNAEQIMHVLGSFDYESGEY